MPRSILTRVRILVGVAGGRRPVRRARAGVMLMALVALPLAGGCRGGVRNLTAPKWPTLGAAKSPPAAADLAAAPATGPIPKPASAATPYATSNAGGDSAAAAMNQGVVQTAGIDPPVVTYGVTPPPAALDAAPPAPMESVAATPIAPQVGRYSELPAPPPAADAPVAAGIPPAVPEHPATAPVAAAPPAPTAAAFPATAGYEPAAAPAPDRFGAPAAPPLVPVAAPAAAPVASPVAATPSGGAVPAAPAAAAGAYEPAVVGAAAGAAAGVPARYASQGSRFGGDAAPDGTIPNAALPAEPAPFPAADALPPAAAASAFAPAPAPFEPQAPPAEPPATPAQEAPAMLPAGTPDGLTTPPVRRRDPVYRPGNTSSYRPAEQVFADEPSTVPSPVRTASFDVVDPPPLPSSPVLR